MTDDIGGANYKKEHKMIFGNTSYDKVKDSNQDYNMRILENEYQKNLKLLYEKNNKEKIEKLFDKKDENNPFNFKNYKKNESKNEENKIS